MSTIHEYATEVSEAFEQGTRTDGVKFRLLNDNSPEWMTDLCHEAHGSMLPDDYRYELIEEAADRLSGLDPADDLDEAGWEYADAADTWHPALAMWLSSHASRAALVDAAFADYGAPLPFSIYEVIRRGQVLERQEVWDAVVTFLKDMANEGSR